MNQKPTEQTEVTPPILPENAPSHATLDPVCGMAVDPAKTPHHLTQSGAHFYFCSAACQAKFIAQRSKPTAASPSRTATTTPGAVVREPMWACPMHPEIRRPGAGSCPICGMALEAAVPSLQEMPNQELQDFTRRFWISVVLAVPLLIVTMGTELLGVHLLPSRVSPWVQLGLTAPLVWWAGWPFFARGWRSVVTRKLNMFTLISIGVGAAFFYSLVATITPDSFPSTFRMHGGMVPVYYEAAGVVVALVLLGQVLELRARAATGKAIRALLNLAPKTARRVHSDGTEQEIVLAEVAVGDHLRIRPGAAIPVDGEVIDGRSAVDESMITGEPLPVAKEAKSTLTGGTVNGTGSLLMVARVVSGDSMLARIVRMVAEAQRSRAPIQAVADRIARWFVPLVLAVAIVSFAVWNFVGPEPRGGHALLNAIAVLIIACPCALGLATPMSIMVATGRGAHAGVLIKHAEALQALDQVDTLVIDKTGTLTEGKPTLTTIVTMVDFHQAQLLALAASVESRSEHPLAHAIVTAAHERSLEVLPPNNFEVQVGLGVTAVVGLQSVVIGNDAQMQRIGIDVTPLRAKAEALRLGGPADNGNRQFINGGAGVMLIAVDGKLAGLIAVTDPVRTNARVAIEALRKQGLRVIMLTGDNVTTANAVAASVGGLDGVHADLKPADKARIVGELKAAGANVAMAGDGINDAPALAAADVGLAMGTGTDVAIESAGITLTKGDLVAVVRARALAKATMRNIRQNLFFSFLFNGIGIPVAAGVLYPVAGILMSPMFAGAAMALSSFAVVMNSLRLSRIKLS